MDLAQAGDTALLVNERDRRRFIRTLEAGRSLHTHRGRLSHDDLIGQPFGSEVKTHLGTPYYLLRPTTDDLITNLIRQTQIIFPKDAGYIIMKLGVQPGSKVVEAGTGSGGLCMALATIVGDDGHVFTYETRESMQEIAKQNIKRAGLSKRVTFSIADARHGFNVQDKADAVFLDMLTPHHALHSARAALKGSGMLGCIMPTANQVIELLNALNANPRYGFVEVEELILRAYKPNAARLRPDDQMVGHTGYLVFARAVTAATIQAERPVDDDDEMASRDEEV